MITERTPEEKFKDDLIVSVSRYLNENAEIPFGDEKYIVWVLKQFLIFPVYIKQDKEWFLVSQYEDFNISVVFYYSLKK